MRWSSAFLYAKGFDIEWSRVSPAGRFVRLPTYPWQRERFWLDDREDASGTRTSQDLYRHDGRAMAAPGGNGRSDGHYTAPIEGRAAPVTIEAESVWHSRSPSAGAGNPGLRVRRRAASGVGRDAASSLSSTSAIAWRRCWRWLQKSSIPIGRS